MFISILLSRVLGIVRDSVMAATFGIGPDTDAYRLAFQIPDLIFFAVAGGALSSAFIPVFSEYYHTDRKQEAWQLYSVVATLMSAIVLTFIALAWVFADPLSALVAPGKSAEERELITTMSRILLPAQFAFFIGGLMFGTLYVRQVFSVPGLGPNVYNLGIIVGAVAISHWVSPGIVGMAWGATVGAFIGNLVVPGLVMARLGSPFRLSLDLKTPGVGKVFKLMLPVVLGLSLPGVYGLVMQGMGSFYAQGTNTALDLSNKLMQAPLGVLGQSMALAIFPALAQFFAEKRMDAYRSQIVKSLASILYVSVPVSVIMALFAPEIVTILFVYGKARDADTTALVDCLRMFSIGIFAWCLHPVLMRGFFAIQKSVMPVVLGTLSTAIFIGSIFALRDTALTFRALPLASSIAALALAILMALALKKEVGDLDLGQLASTALKAFFASTVAGGLAFAAVYFIPDPSGGLKNVVALLKLGGAGTLAMLLYAFITKAMRMPEIEVLDRALGKLSHKLNRSAK